MQRMLGFMTICMVAMSVNMHKFNNDKSLIPQRGALNFAVRNRNEKMTLKQRKARKRAKNNRRKCTKRR